MPFLVEMTTWSQNDAEVKRERAAPEILPPGTGPAPDTVWREVPVNGGPVGVPREPRRAPRSWAAAPATYLLVGINVAVFLLMVLNGVSPTSPTPRELLQWGATQHDLVLFGGEWWRLITATFVHIGIIHLATNMWCLWNLGLLGEPLLGAWGMIAVYLLTGTAGNLLSVAISSPHSVSAGASGAVFGLAGVLIVLLKSKYLPVPPAELKGLRRSVIYFAVLNFAIGAGTLFLPSSVPKIDNMAHLGGFLLGLAVGVPLVPKIGAGRDRYRRRQTLVFGGMLILLLTLGYGVASYYGVSFLGL
ncbi:MAG TPA: rhomboid family intramembrane serine protease [Acidobacteriaceae bacterium]|nr:rhomboid family intramembrane serine protease [Acidobacteriaceae bacterium]